MSNRGGNGGFSHSGVQPNHTSQRTFGTNRPQTINHQPRHIMQPNSANISQAVSNAGIPFHHQYVSQTGLMHHQMPPQMPQRYPTPNQHQQIPFQYMTQIPTLFYPNHALLQHPQFAAIARTVPGATTNQPYNVGQGMVTSTENLSYYNEQYMTQPPTQDMNSVNPGMQHMAAPVVPPKSTNEPKARKKAEIRDPATDKVLTEDDLRSPVPLKPETKPSKSSTSNATSTTRENTASATDDRSQKTQEFMDGITKAATATYIKDKSNIYDNKANKSASETNRKEATLPNDTYPQSYSKEPTLIIQNEKSDESAESIEIAEQSSDSMKKESTPGKDVSIKSSPDDSVPDSSVSKKSVKPTKSSESTDKAVKPSGTESAKAGPEKKVKEQISNLDVRIDNDQVTIATDVLPEPKKDSIKTTNGSTTLPFNKTVIENKTELKAAEPTQISSVDKDIPNSIETSPVSEAKDTPSEEIRSIVPSDGDHVSVMVREDSVSPQDELSSPKDISEASADSVSTNEVEGDTSEAEKPALDYPKVNSKGKYEYEADFLRSLQSHPLSLKKPDLPDLDIVQQVPIPHREKQTNRVNDFLPSYMARANNRSLPSRIGGRPSRELRPPKPPIKIIPSPSLTHEVALHTVENAWKPAIPALKPVENIDEEEKKTVDLVKRFRGILNKLTPQKYDDLIKQVDALVIDTEDKLKRVLELIFDKAVDEPAFCTDYAKLCKHISTAEKSKKSNDKKDDTSEKEDKAKEKQFRQLLLSRCQREFESGIYSDIDIEGRLLEIASITDPEKRRIADLELEEDKRKARKRSLGIIKFIGELYMFNMLSVVIMDSCIIRLLDARDDESLECLCTLLRTVGAKWEQDNVKRPKQSDNVLQTEYCIGVLKAIVQNRSTSSRVRFMIQDVLDMKQAGWKVRKIQADNKPKTIEQLHAEIQQEEQTKKHEIQQHINKTEGNRKPPSKQDEWNSQRNSRSNAPNMALIVETLRKATANSTQSDNVSLQPQRGLWGSGASLGQGAGSSQRSSNSDIFGRNSLNERDKNTRTSGNTMGRDSMEGRVQSSGHSFRPFSSLEGQAHSDYPGRASTGNRMPSTVAPFSSSSDSAKKDNSSRSNSMEKTRLVESRSSSSSNIARESPKKEAGSAVKFEGDPAIDPTKLEERLKGAFEQYLVSGIKEGCREDVLNACTATNVGVFVEVVFGSSLDISSLDKKLATGEVLAYLLKEKVIKQEQFIKGLHAILTMAEDLIIDVPKLWENLADILVPIFCRIEDSTRKKLFTKSLETIKSIKQGAAITMFHVLNFKKSNFPDYDCASAWVTGGLEWSSFLPPDEKDKSPEEFFKKHNLTLPQFDLQVKLDQMSNFVNKYSPAQLGEQLLKHFTPEEVKEPKFLRALTHAVTTKCIVPGSNNVSHRLNQKKFSEFCAVLAKFHNGLKKLELEIIFTVQELLSDYENPKGLLQDIFECLHRKANISDQAFIDWEGDSLRVKNKGSAVHMVKDFLTRVKEGGSGSDS